MQDDAKATDCLIRAGVNFNAAYECVDDDEYQPKVVYSLIYNIILTRSSYKAKMIFSSTQVFSSQPILVNCTPFSILLASGNQLPVMTVLKFELILLGVDN